MFSEQVIHSHVSKAKQYKRFYMRNFPYTLPIQPFPNPCLGSHLYELLEYILKKYLFIYLAALGLNCSMWDLQSSLQHTGLFSCSMWDLFPWLGLEPGPPASWVQSLSQWTTREVPWIHFWCFFMQVEANSSIYFYFFLFQIQWRRKWQPTPVFFFFSLIFISWRLSTLQYCSGFCHTLTWISHGFTCVPHPYSPSRLPPHTHLR